MHTWTYTQ